MTSTCRETVSRTYGRDEFQSRTYNERCGRPVEDGHQFCARHEAQHAAEFAQAKAKQALRAARAARSS
jgi:hypothetical protein